MNVLSSYANIISLVRLYLLPAVFYSIATNQKPLLVALLLIVGAYADVLAPWIFSLKKDRTSLIQAMQDTTFDKIFIVSVYAFLLDFPATRNVMPARWLVWLVMAKEIALLCSMYMIYASNLAHQTPHLPVSLPWWEQKIVLTLHLALVFAILSAAFYTGPLPIISGIISALPYYFLLFHNRP